jgi:hypothetical protein
MARQPRRADAAGLVRRLDRAGRDHTYREQWYAALEADPRFTDSPPDRDLLLAAYAIASRARNDGTQAVMSNHALARATRSGLRSAERRSATLRDMGYLVLVERGGHRGDQVIANQYDLTLRAEVPNPPAMSGGLDPVDNSDPNPPAIDGGLGESSTDPNPPNRAPETGPNPPNRGPNPPAMSGGPPRIPHEEHPHAGGRAHGRGGRDGRRAREPGGSRVAGDTEPPRCTICHSYERSHSEDRLTAAGFQPHTFTSA